jgi:hypothetical protein
LFNGHLLCKVCQHIERERERERTHSGVLTIPGAASGLNRKNAAEGPGCFLVAYWHDSVNIKDISSDGICSLRLVIFMDGHNQNHELK